MNEPPSGVPRSLLLLTVTLGIVFVAVVAAILTHRISRARCAGRYSAHAVYRDNFKINVRGSGVPECYRVRSEPNLKSDGLAG